MYAHSICSHVMYTEIVAICSLYSRNIGLHHWYFCINIGGAFYKNMCRNGSSIPGFSHTYFEPLSGVYITLSCFLFLLKYTGVRLAPRCNGICSLSPLGHRTESGSQQQHLKAVTVLSMALLKTKATVNSFSFLWKASTRKGRKE